MEVWPEALKELGTLVATGKLKYREIDRAGHRVGARGLPRPAQGQELRQAAGQAGLAAERRTSRHGRLILHHYATSPFSEKVRLVLGNKGLRWRSVTVPRMLPKPDVVALTGGYRRTPFLQIGADIYCDTRADVPRDRPPAPEPPLYPHTDARHRRDRGAVGRLRAVLDRDAVHDAGRRRADDHGARRARADPAAARSG